MLRLTDLRQATNQVLISLFMLGDKILNSQGRTNLKQDRRCGAQLNGLPQPPENILIVACHTSAATYTECIKRPRTMCAVGGKIGYGMARKIPKLK